MTKSRMATAIAALVMIPLLSIPNPNPTGSPANSDYPRLIFVGLGWRGRDPRATVHEPADHILNGASEGQGDRKSTRLNSSHLVISYAVFCLKKKKSQTHD